MSLPVRGAWIEICLSMMCATFPHGRSPCGERGLKYHAEREGVAGLASLPVRGAWIEIRVEGGILMEHPSLPVRGAWIEIPRDGRNEESACRSLPVRGAWIEISRMTMARPRRCPSLPVRGAWIEIPWCEEKAPGTFCRSPCGERGLKCFPPEVPAPGEQSLPVRGAWIEMPCNSCGSIGIPRVAPRAGSVD